MSHLSPSELTALRAVALEIRETWSARGYKVGTALSLDSDFTENQAPRSVLTRAIIRRAYVRGATKAKLWCDNGPGGSKELHSTNGSVEHILRLLKATNEGGQYVIRAKDDSMLRNLEITLLGRQERWVFAYTLTDDDLCDIFVAPVHDFIEGSPGRLVLGPAILLDSPSTPPSSGRFQPDNDEDLDLGGGALDEEGWDEDESDDELGA